MMIVLLRSHHLRSGKFEILLQSSEFRIEQQDSDGFGNVCLILCISIIIIIPIIVISIIRGFTISGHEFPEQSEEDEITAQEIDCDCVLVEKEISTIPPDDG